MPNTTFKSGTKWRFGFAILACSVVVLGTSPAVAVPSATVHALPVGGANGVTQLCGPESDYVCTTGGYGGRSVDWPGQKYGAGWASSNSFGLHNCTLYAAYRLRANGLGDPGWSANANGWDTSAAAAGARVDQSPAIGSIAQWNGGSSGHVAYVEVITRTYIEVTDDNYGTNVTDRFRIPVGSASWPDNFIHLRDLAAAPSSLQVTVGMFEPNTQTPINSNPKHSSRSMTIQVVDDKGNTALSTQTTAQQFARSGYYTGVVSLPSGFKSGYYQVKVRLDYTLRSYVEGISTINSGVQNGLPATGGGPTLIAGDANQDNAINILDYNLMLDCYSDLTPPRGPCDATKKRATDFNDDGSVNQLDYNLYLREVGRTGGA